MEFEGKKIDLSDLVSDKYMHKEINKNIILSEYQIVILKNNGIDCFKYDNIKMLLYDINLTLEEDYDEKLDEISKEISEYYYNNINK